MTPESFATALAAAQIADGTVGTIVDRNGAVVATTQGPEQVGKPAPAGLISRAREGDQAVFTGPSPDGSTVYTAFNPRPAVPVHGGDRGSGRAGRGPASPVARAPDGGRRRRSGALTGSREPGRAAVRRPPPPAEERVQRLRARRDGAGAAGVPAGRARGRERGPGRRHGAHADPERRAPGVGAALPRPVRAQPGRDVPVPRGRPHRGLQRGVRPDAGLRARSRRAGGARGRSPRPAEGSRPGPSSASRRWGPPSTSSSSSAGATGGSSGCS